jgi:hypothetical protein
MQLNELLKDLPNYPSLIEEFTDDGVLNIPYVQYRTKEKPRREVFEVLPYPNELTLDVFKQHYEPAKFLYARQWVSYFYNEGIQTTKDFIHSSILELN